MFLVVATVAVMSFPGQAQQRLRRAGGPRDWSHGRLVASGYGSDDPNVRKDWRTLRRHQLIENARANVSAVTDWLPWIREGGLRSGTAGTSTGSVELDWSLNTGGTGSVIGYPAKYSFDITTPNCSDVIYYTVNHQGTSTRPNVIAITNPYAGCPGNPANLTPTVKWALRLPYGTGTSPTLSLDGTILYVVESRASGQGGPIIHAILVNNIVTNTGTYNFNTGAWSNVHQLAAPTGLPNSEQLFALTFSGTSNTLSSPYLDYDTNRLYFGDSGGRIHRIINATSANAAEDAGWPISCGTSALQSPMVYANQVITGSTDGRLYRINMAAGSPTCISAMQVGGGTQESTAGSATSPTIDVTNNKIIVGAGDTQVGDYKAMAMFNLNFASNEGPVGYAYLGVYDGNPAQFPALDNDFWTTNDGSLYAIGNGEQTNTLLIRIPYNGAVMGTPAGYAQLRRTGQAARVGTSPVVEFLTALTSGNPDFIFVGGNGGNYNYMNRIASGFGGTATSPVSMAGYFGTTSGVSSGISVDTRTTSMTGTTATANIYFGTAGGSVNSVIVQLAQQF